MVDKMLGRHISSRDSFDIRSSIETIVNLLISNQQVDIDADKSDHSSSGARFNINFVCDERVPRKAITYGQEIKQSVLLILEFCADSKVKKTISINVWHSEQKSSTVQITIKDRKLVMSQQELDSAFNIKSAEHPYGNDRLYLVQAMLDQF